LARHPEIARRALDAYTGVEGYDTGDEWTNLCDLLADLLHLADEIAPPWEIGGDEAVSSAKFHYYAERVTYDNLPAA
jgi:hypothetical protein